MDLIRVELAGRETSLRLNNDRVVEIGPRPPAPSIGEVLDARGGAILPGLHDHHLHLAAWAAAAGSVDCGPACVGDADELRVRLQQAEPGGDGWIRGVAYHESVAGPIGAPELDALRADVPIRVQHRSGQLWMLNRMAIQELRVRAPGPLPAGLDEGRVFRADSWLRECLGGSRPPLGAIARELAGFGITGVTEATPDNDAETVAWVDAARAAGDFPQHVHWMGGPGLPPAADAAAPARPVKLVLDDRALPHPDAVTRRVRDAHENGRPIAVHCVTRAELVVACAAIEAAGAIRGDRIEHASIAPPELAEWMARLGVQVATQPGFLFERGDAYLREVDAADLPWLHRIRGLQAAGVAVGGGSDAPYASADPWLGMAAAVRRRTAAGTLLGGDEAVSPEAALALYTTSPEAPGGAERRVEVGGVADLCVLDRPWAEARQDLARVKVRYTICAGELIYDASERGLAAPAERPFAREDGG